MERSCEEDTGNSTAHLSQDAESSVVSFDMDGGNVDCRDGLVSEVLAAQHEDILFSNQVELQVWSMNAYNPSPGEAVTSGYLAYFAKQRG